MKIAAESRTLATITFQNYFRMYKKLSGKTGTAKTEATEFTEIYGLKDVYKRQVWDFLAQQIGSGGEKDESLPHESDTTSWG